MQAEVPNKDAKGFQTLKLSAPLPVPILDRDQAKIKFWRDRAIQAEARLAERDRQVQRHSQEILDLRWKAKVAADWTQVGASLP